MRGDLQAYNKMIECKRPERHAGWLILGVLLRRLLGVGGRGMAWLVSFASLDDCAVLLHLIPCTF